MADYDVVVVGGGPAGLTSAIYLSRYHLRTLVIDNRRSRALMIPLSHNRAGYPEGISGRALVDRMREQAVRYGTMLSDGTVTAIAGGEDGFVVDAGTRIAARAVLLATGVRNRRPAMDDTLHDAALATGRLRYCPVCDGYEVTDKRIAVVGSGEHGTREALFLRSYSRDVTLVAPDGPHVLDADQQAKLAAGGIIAVDGPSTGYVLADAGLELTAGGATLAFDSLCPALGSDVHSALAGAMGARVGEDGSIIVDAHQRTSVAGLYAAGDVVLGLDQISNAMGAGGVAATTIRNDLAQLQPLRR